MSRSSIREFISSIPKILSKNPSSDVLKILSRLVMANKNDNILNFRNHVKPTQVRSPKIQMKLIDRNKINF